MTHTPKTTRRTGEIFCERGKRRMEVSVTSFDFPELDIGERVPVTELLPGDRIVSAETWERVRAALATAHEALMHYKREPGAAFGIVAIDEALAAIDDELKEVG